MSGLRPSWDDEESTAAAIYGVIVGAAVMSAAHAETAAALDVAVLVTLVIYWGAERYARVVAERIHSGHRPDWSRVRRQLTSGWEMVTASVLPLAVLTGTSQIGASLDEAVLCGLLTSTLVLCLAGWEMGRNGALSRLERVASAATAGAFGIFMITLKSLLH